MITIGNWLYINGDLKWVGVDMPTMEEINDMPNVIIEANAILKQQRQKEARAKLLTATDFFELPSHKRLDWIEWRQAVRDWKQGECPVPPNETEYCLNDLWDSGLHKPKY